MTHTHNLFENITKHLEAGNVEIVKKLQYYGLFDKYISDPTPRKISNYTIGANFISKYPVLESNIDLQEFLIRNPEKVNDFMEKCVKDDEIWKQLLENEFASVLVAFLERYPGDDARDFRVLDWIPSMDNFSRDDANTKFGKEFKEAYSVYLSMNFRKPMEIHMKEYDEKELTKQMASAKEFIDEYGGFVSGGAALAFYNMINDIPQSRRFMPSDVDVITKSKKMFDRCLEKFESSYQVCHYRDTPITSITYFQYGDAWINLILVYIDPVEYVKTHDMEFCKLIWDGDFHQSSKCALLSAHTGSDIVSINDYSARHGKYVRRGYKMIFA